MFHSKIKLFAIIPHFINFNSTINHLEHTISIHPANIQNNINFMKQFDHLLFLYHEFSIFNFIAIFYQLYKIDKEAVIVFLICIHRRILFSLYLGTDCRYLGLKNSIQAQSNGPDHTYGHQKI